MTLIDIQKISSSFSCPTISGTYLQMLDNKSRIFLNVEMRSYFDFPKKDENEPSYCYIGYPDDLVTPCLVILNQTVHEEIGKNFKPSILDNFNRVNTKAMKELREGLGLFHKVEIKSNRIQLNKTDRKLLNLPEDDKRIVIVGMGLLYNVWPLAEYRLRHKRVADFLEEYS